MKIKLVVLYTTDDRKKYIEKQFDDLGIFNVDYKGFTPSTSVDYINYKNEEHIEDETICCRSYFSIFDTYSKLDYDYIITMEDNISLINSFHSKIIDIIEVWEKYPDIEFVSLGYLLSFDYKEIKDTENENNFYYDISKYNKLSGTQMLSFKKSTLIKLNSLECTLKYKRTRIDYILLDLCKYGMVYPPLAIENQKLTTQIVFCKDNYPPDGHQIHDVNFSLYYNIKKHNKTIGLSFAVPDEPDSMFSNGHKQNTLYFFEVLYLLGYDVYLILDKPLIKGIYDFNYKKYKSVLYDLDLNSTIKFDIVFQFGWIFPIDFLRKLKNQCCKIIAYKCGCDYVLDLEKSLFSSDKDIEKPQCSTFLKERIFDEIWSIPQHETLNYYYWKTLYKCPVVLVPFIWSNKHIESCSKLNNLSNDGIYSSKNKQLQKKIAIFEPNLNIVKFALPAVLICENTYRSNPDIIKFVYITNSKYSPDYTFNNSYFSKMLYSLDLYNDKKLSSEARFQTIFFMNNYADIAVSHQWGNPLNYLYLELAWMGWPILHNGSLCSDIGYYYEGFNYEQGGEMLEYIIKTHDNNADYYLERNRKLIDRYLPTNIQLQNTYKTLIERLCN